MVGKNQHLKQDKTFQYVLRDPKNGFLLGSRAIKKQEAFKSKR